MQPNTSKVNAPAAASLVPLCSRLSSALCAGDLVRSIVFETAAFLGLQRCSLWLRRIDASGLTQACSVEREPSAPTVPGNMHEASADAKPVAVPEPLRELLPYNCLLSLAATAPDDADDGAAAVVAVRQSGHCIGLLYLECDDNDHRLTPELREQLPFFGRFLGMLLTPITTANGETVRLDTLLKSEFGSGYQNIRHYNFKRSITINADIDEDKIDAVAANNLIREHWDSIRTRHPGINLDFTGVLDDIEENLSGISLLFVIGIGLIYLILGTQFKSYLQPLMILVSVPLAFIGVVFGLAITNNPIYTDQVGILPTERVLRNPA